MYDSSAYLLNCRIGGLARPHSVSAIALREGIARRAIWREGSTAAVLIEVLIRLVMMNRKMESRFKLAFHEEGMLDLFKSNYAQISLSPQKMNKIRHCRYLDCRIE